MSRSSYASELDRVLTPLGFAREKPGAKDWSRTRGDRLETVDLQTSSIAGTTANLYSRDLALEALLREAMPNGSPAHFAYGGKRIGHLIDGYDRWWRQDPNGPKELAGAIAAHAPAYFDSLLMPVAVSKLREFAAEDREWSQATGVIRLALMLHRVGEKEEACKVLDRKLSKFTPKALLDDVESVRRWLGCAR